MRFSVTNLRSHMGHITGSKRKKKSQRNPEINIRDFHFNSKDYGDQTSRSILLLNKHLCFFHINMEYTLNYV